ncbi:GNAT family N-acetyltransferase [Streptomyces sp. H27-D2]|uniref:GNAT family N-acetyltransferase n=1 Tax=Streptomyces sp. H27-D2 TaxID=3046304 RepID=UPI002DBAEE69|nr:GNAT family N-acetyltransferase [Streptomyces sp. H27-D2]MEC4016619.1 GNAT family N-acetyltransferase [Streptomyces sp. H27-D2]
MTDVRTPHTLHTAHTADLAPAELEAIRALLTAAFEGDFDEADWDHTVGGVHAVLREGGELIGHGSVVQRRLLHGGRALRTGYVEGVAVRADRRGRGHGAAVMDALERVLRGAYELGALSASQGAAEFYAARGWQRWRGPTSVLAPDGLRRTEEDDGSTFVLPAGGASGAAYAGVAAGALVTSSGVPLDPAGALVCDWRDGDVW